MYIFVISIEFVAHPTFLAGFCLCNCFREQILYEASQQPLMGHRPYVSTSYVEYPNVYDAMATAQRTPAYIAGTKVEYTIYYST